MISNTADSSEPVPGPIPPRSGFSDVDRSGAAGNLIGYLDAARSAPSVKEAKEWSLQHLELRPGAVALDVGCGTGEDVVEMLRRIGPEGSSVGVDASEAMVSEAVRRHERRPNLHFELADAERLPFRPETFDAVRCERTLQHVREPALAVAEMARVLRPGGRVTLQEPDWGTLVVEGADSAVTDLVVANHVTRHAQFRIGRKLPALMTSAGLRVEEVGAQAVVYTDLASSVRAFGLGHAAPWAVTRGIINEDDGEKWIADLQRADAVGGFLASVTGFRAQGRK